MAALIRAGVERWWSADYIALWNEEAKQLDLTGRATLANTAGADFPQAEVSLIAGAVYRQPQPGPPVPLARAEAAPMAAEAKSLPVRQEFGDLHLYKVPGKVSLADQQTRQVILLPTARLSVDPEYVSEAGNCDLSRDQRAAADAPARAAALSERAGQWRRAADGGSGAGLRDSGRRHALAAGGGPDRPHAGGRDRNPDPRRGLRHHRAAPADRLREYRTAGRDVGSAWTIEVKNARDKPATVGLVEVVPGDWIILAESAPHEKQTADRPAWRLSVPGKGAAELTYRIRVKHMAGWRGLTVLANGPYLREVNTKTSAMSNLAIIVAPDPLLKRRAKPVAGVDRGVRRLMDSMLETMHAAHGIGLAAPQVGVLQRVIVVDISQPDEPANPYRMANPEVVWRSAELVSGEEGCLSLPEQFGEVTRPAAVGVRYLDQDGEARELEAQGLLAKCVQHEIDHLEGVLFVDHLSSLKRNIILRRLAKAKKLSAAAE